MLLNTKHWKKQSTFYLGILYWHIRHLNNPGDFDEATEALAEIAAQLGVSWAEVEDSCKACQQRKEELQQG